MGHGVTPNVASHDSRAGRAPGRPAVTNALFPSELGPRTRRLVRGLLFATERVSRPTRAVRSSSKAPPSRAAARPFTNRELGMRRRNGTRSHPDLAISNGATVAQGWRLFSGLARP